MRTRTPGIILSPDGTRHIEKRYRGERIFERLGRVSQEQAESILRQRQGEIEARQEQGSQPGADRLFRVAAGKYLMELQEASDVRTLDTIAGHILLLNQWVGDLPMAQVCNDSFGQFKRDRLAGRTAVGKPARKVKPATVNRALEVARTILSRAARVWRTDGKPWLGAAPLIEMLDERATKRKPRPITWAEQQQLLPRLPPHLAAMTLFAVNTGARDANICGLRWAWEMRIPELGRSVFVIPASEFKSKRDHVLVLNDVAWGVVEAQRGLHKDFVFVYRRERVTQADRAPKMAYRRIGTINNTAFQRARAEAGLAGVRVHDLRHTFGQRLREAGVAEEDRAMLMGHAVEGMAQHYATATVARLLEAANRVQETRDNMTILRLVSGA